MCLSARTTTGRRRKRVIFIPKTPQYAKTPRYAESAVTRSLKTHSNERDLLNVAAIWSLLSKWPSFVSYFPDEKIQKDICQAIDYNKFDDARILYRPNDITDGWYFVLSGCCYLVEECISADEISEENELPPEYQKLLRESARNKAYRHYKIVERKMPTQEFGFIEMKKNLLRKYYCITIGETELLKIDPYTFKLIYTMHERQLHTDKINLLTSNSNLLILLDNDDVLNNVAYALKDLNLDKGYIINNNNPLAHGIVIIEDGIIQVRRVVNFDKVTLSKYQLTVGDKEIALPQGINEIPTKKLANGDALPLPEMYYPKNTYNFVAEVKKDSKCYLLEYSDFFSMIPMYMQKNILKKILDKRNDQEVVEDWLKKQKVLEWRVYKKKVLKEARQFIKATKPGDPEEIISRKPRPPKGMIDYNPFKRRSLRSLQRSQVVEEIEIT